MEKNTNIDTIISNNLVNDKLKDTISSQSNTISKIEADNINNAYLNNNMLTISQLITKKKVHKVDMNVK